MKSYKGKLTWERLNDGKYVVEVAYGGSVERYSYESLDAIVEVIPSLQSDIEAYESQLDESE